LPSPQIVKQPLAKKKRKGLFDNLSLRIVA